MNFMPKWLDGGIRRVFGRQSNNPLMAFAGKKRNVTEETAMQISAVWAAVNLKAGTLASLALDFYETTSDEKRTPSTRNDLARLFKGKVNRYQTRMEFFETVGLNLYLTGNSTA